jgi:hypothetical protein
VNETDRLLATKILAEDRYDARSLYDSLTPHEQALARDLIEELQAGGPAQKLRALWDLDYETRPVSPTTFLTDPYYMGVPGRQLYPCWQKILPMVLDQRNQIYEFIIGGALGVGKTTAAALAISYHVYLLECRRSPQEFFGLMDGSQIVFGFFNVFKGLSEEVGYGKFAAFCDTSEYFKGLAQTFRARSGRRLRVDPTTKFAQFPKGIRIKTGKDGVHALGADCIGGLMDEADFGKAGATLTEKGQMEKLYHELRARMASRFLNTHGGFPGILCLASSAKDEADFSQRHLRDVQGDPNTFHASFSLWEAKPDLDTDRQFYVLLPTGMVGAETLDFGVEPPAERDFISVPEPFFKQFKQDPGQALRDFAGIPVAGTMRLIPDKAIITDSVRKHIRQPWESDEILVGLRQEGNPLIEAFKRRDVARIWDELNDLWEPKLYPSAPRYVHLDIAEAPGRNRYGMAMCTRVGGRVVTRKDDRGRPRKYALYDYLWDFAVGLTCKQGDRVSMQKVREFLIWLRDTMRYHIVLITTDGYQSSDTRQMLEMSGFETKLVSADRDDAAYTGLRNAMREGRTQWSSEAQILMRELTYLERHYTGRIRANGEHVTKIDHPSRNPDGTMGSKDAADAVACSWKDAADAAQEMLLPDDPSIVRSQDRNLVAEDDGAWVSPASRSQHHLDEMFDDD